LRFCIKTLIIILFWLRPAPAQVVKEFNCDSGSELKVTGGKLTCVKRLTVSQAADKLEELADTFIPKTRILIQRYKDAQAWAEINPDHADALRLKEEIARREPEEKTLIDQLASLVREILPIMSDKKLSPTDSKAANRVLATIHEMLPIQEECLREARRYHALD